MSTIAVTSSPGFISIAVSDAGSVRGPSTSASSARSATRSISGPTRSRSSGGRPSRCRRRAVWSGAGGVPRGARFRTSRGPAILEPPGW